MTAAYDPSKKECAVLYSVNRCAQRVYERELELRYKSNIEYRKALSLQVSDYLPAETNERHPTMRNPQSFDM
uniref:Uncharacterized protein n=1 Tax=Parascaris equorum TaxID=6256 RepID=A0A914RTN5_PAREQ